MTRPLGIAAEVPGLAKPSTKKGRLQRAALTVLREHKAADELPTSVRFVFYELEQRGLVSKEQTGKRRPAQDLTDAIMALREAGLVPWGWIVDDTRTMHSWRSAVSVADYIAESIPRARIELWGGELQPVILTESRTVGGVFARGIAWTYLCPVAATNGQVGGFLVTEVAPMLEDEQTRVLYVGDWDLAGNQIETNTRDVLGRHAGRVFDTDTWERVALTDDQAETLRANGVSPILKTDGRYKDRRPHEAYEVEALGQALVTSLMRDRLDGLLPEPLDDVLEREEDEREQVALLLDAEERDQ